MTVHGPTQRKRSKHSAKLVHRTGERRARDRDAEMAQDRHHPYREEIEAHSDDHENKPEKNGESRKIPGEELRYRDFGRCFFSSNYETRTRRNLDVRPHDGEQLFEFGLAAW